MKINQLKLSINQYICFIACLLLMAVVPICREHKLFGFEIGKEKDSLPNINGISQENDITLINTSEVGKNIIGFGGPTPVEIQLKDGKIEKIKVLPNQETPEFLGSVTNSDLLDSYKGLTLEEASEKKVDAITGATFTSKAIIGNIRAGVNLALGKETADEATAGNDSSSSIITYNSDGTMSVNTTELGKDIRGFKGAVPVEVRIKDGKIEKIKVLENDETPEYIGSVINSDMIDSFYGKSLEEAEDLKVDAVTGATYSSEAVLANIKAGVEYALGKYEFPQADAHTGATSKADAHTGATSKASTHKEAVSETSTNTETATQSDSALAEEEGNPSEENALSVKFFITILIILMGAILPLFIKNQKYRILQLILNVGVLGFWGGTFISYALMVSSLTYGMTKVILIPVMLMLVTAFIYPMFGKSDHYCLWLCPYGAIQELAGKCFKKKLPISPKWIKGLTFFRQALWFGLMLLLWTGLWFDWMGYEPFAAFFILDASPVVLSIAGAFLLLSFFVNRPYCRFVCPTGSLFKLSEGRK